MSEKDVRSRTSSEIFEEVLDRRLRLCKEILGEKAKEYAANSDRFHNFNRAALILGTTPENALIGMFTKHLVSVLDMIDKVAFHTPSKELIDEKIGDSINYLILLEGLLIKRREMKYGHVNN